MEDYQLRVIEEKRELDERLARLDAFFEQPGFFSLGRLEQDRMKRQAGYMRAYSSTLRDRIADFEGGASDA